MSMSDEQKTASVRNALDLTIVGDNIGDIALFTIEKYEFKNNSTLSPEIREEAIAQIKDVLCQRVEELKRRRLQILAEMFTTAENALDEVVNKGK
jgi:hypothetical protein